VGPAAPSSAGIPVAGQAQGSHLLPALVIVRFRAPARPSLDRARRAIRDAESAWFRGDRCPALPVSRRRPLDLWSGWVY